MISYKQKLYTAQSFQPQLHLLKEKGNKIVFTNGCFDIIHLGHIQYLEQARNLGDYLIIGINSDESIKRLKGNSRPIQNLDNRMGILAALACVDAVIPFEDDNPLALIKSILPDFLVKGGDWDIQNIVGGELVINNGGTVKQISFLEGHSTSNIIDTIIQKHTS